MHFSTQNPSLPDMTYNVFVKPYSIHVSLLTSDFVTIVHWNDCDSDMLHKLAVFMNTMYNRHACESVYEHRVPCVGRWCPAVRSEYVTTSDALQPVRPTDWNNGPSVAATTQTYRHIYTVSQKSLPS